MHQSKWRLSVRFSVALISFFLVLPISASLTVHGETIPDFVGLGTATEPYLIQDLDDLLALGALLDSPATGALASPLAGVHFRQTAAIDLTPVTPWKPLAIGQSGFAGTYDGQHFDLTGLTLQPSGVTGTGLFSRNLGTIRNVRLIGVATISASVPGVLSVGALVGTNKGLIERCTASGLINTTAGTVGGLVGYQTVNDADLPGAPIVQIRDCYSTITIRGTGNNWGGLIGEIAAGTLQTSYSSGDLIGTDGYDFLKRYGGLAGVINSDATVSDCFAVGLVNDGNLNAYKGGVAAVNTGMARFVKTAAGTAFGIDNAVFDPEFVATGVPLSLFQSRSGFETDDPNRLDDGWSTQSAWNFAEAWEIDPQRNDSLPILQVHRLDQEIDQTETSASIEPTSIPSESTSATETTENSTRSSESTSDLLETTTATEPTHRSPSNPHPSSEPTPSDPTATTVISAVDRTITTSQPVTRSAADLTTIPQPESSLTIPQTGERSPDPGWLWPILISGLTAFVLLALAGIRLGPTR